MTDLATGILLDVYSIDADKIALATYQPIKDRILRTANRKGQDIWNARDWTYRYITGTGTFTGGTGVWEIDVAWANEGRDGIVYLTDGMGGPLTWKRAGELRQRLLANNARRGRPQNYTVTSEEAGVRILQCEPIPDSDAAFAFVVQTTAPALTYASPSDPDGLETLIPNTDFHDVLYEMVAAIEYAKKGNRIDAAAAEKRAKEGLFAMVCTESQGKPEIQNMPRFAGSADMGVSGGDWP